MADHKNFTNQKSQHAFVRKKDAPYCHLLQLRLV